MTHQNYHLKLNYYKLKQTTANSVQALARIVPLETSPMRKPLEKIFNLHPQVNWSFNI
jgi:hypothetical protein